MHVFHRLSSGLTATQERHAQPRGSPDRTPSKPTRTNPESTSSRTTRLHRDLATTTTTTKSNNISIEHIHTIDNHAVIPILPITNSLL